MIDLEESIDVSKPAPELYDFVVTNYVRNHPRWDPQCLSTTLDDGGTTLSVGATGKEVRKSMGTHTFVFKVRELTDDHVTFDSTGGGATFAGVWTVKPSQAGSRLTINFQLTFGGVMGLFEPLMKGGVRKEMRGSAARIKEMVEAGAQVA